MKSDDSTFGYVSVNALMEFARNHVDRKVDCNDIARFPRSNVRNADEQQSLQQIFGIPFARLRELAEAEREGRVVVLPCKVGQTFYGVNRDSGHIYEQVFDYAEVCLMEKSRDGKRGNRGYSVLDKGKKTKIYLDRKAAERALSEKGEATTCQ